MVEDDVVPVTSQLARLHLPVRRTERPTERWVEHHHVVAGRPSRTSNLVASFVQYRFVFGAWYTSKLFNQD